MLEDIAPYLRQLAKSEPLTTAQIRSILKELALHDDAGFYYLALTFGVMAKGPTIDELRGFCLHYADVTPKLKPNVDYSRTVDVSGTGGDAIKTFNVGTTASFVLAGAGAIVGKQAFKSWTSVSGSLEILQQIGVNVPIQNGNPSDVERCLESTGMAAFYYPSFSDAYKNNIDFSKHMMSIGLRYVTPFHLTRFAFSPLPLATRLYGVFDEKWLVPLSRLVSDLGCERVFTVWGRGGLDEVSIIGGTKVCETSKHGEPELYEITPDDFGLKTAGVQDILGKTAQQNASDLLRIVYGRERGPKRDMVLANCGLALYGLGLSKDLRDGVHLAEASIDDGNASNHLESLVDFNHGRESLEPMLTRLGLKPSLT